MNNDRRDLTLILWFLGILWTLVFASLSYIAFSEKSISLWVRGGGVAHFEGSSAIWVGFAMLGAALVPLDFLADLKGYVRPVRALLVVGWLGCVVGYVMWR